MACQDTFDLCTLQIRRRGVDKVHQFSRINDNRGYTLIESLLQLVLFVVFVHLFILFIFWKEPIERQFANMSDTAWEMFAVDLQDSIADVEEFKVHEGGRGIQFLTGRGRIDIEYRSGVIRKLVDGLGHVPFLTGVYTIRFTFDGMVLFVDATMLDGTRKERTFAVGLNPK